MAPDVRFEPPDLTQALHRLLAQIPPGRVTTYGALARALGDVRAAVWVAEHLAVHRHEERCPCHRVVRVSGDLGRFVTGRLSDKSSLLVAEGVPVREGRVALAGVAMEAAEFDSPAPLRALQAWQRRLAEQVVETPLTTPPRWLCGLDVAYPSPDVARGAAVLLDAASLTTVWESSCTASAAFPYIPGYLAVRELPVLLDLWELVLRALGQKLSTTETVCFVDGNGRLHPRRAGVACCFGVLADVPTIGLGKSLLCGTVENGAGASASQTIAGAAAVRDGTETIGAALPGRQGGRPLYVSVGHRLTLREAVQVVRQCTTQHRLPEPLYRADRRSRK